MFVVQPHFTRLATGPESHPSIHIPMIYEQVVPDPVHWEYHTLSIDPGEAALPDTEILNKLGQDGWLLIGLLDTRATGTGKVVHYYFVRQTQN